jgi:hypothetical protein
MMIPIFKANGTGSALSQWRPMRALMLSGTTLAMLRITSIRNYSIPGALMAA